MRALLLLAAAAFFAPPPPAGPYLLPAETEGFGLAAKFPGDAGMAEHSAVLLVEGFEEDGLAERWDGVKGAPKTLRFTEEGSEVHTGSRALRIDYRPGEGTGGHLYKSFSEGYERLHFRFYVKFPADHGYVHHFVHLMGYRPATPWPQGGAGSRPRGDERFSTGLDIFGDWGRTPPPGRWGFYSYWCEMAVARDGKFWGNHPPGGKEVRVARDRWICAEFMVAVNDREEADGSQAFWIDGKCAGRWGGYRWRKHEELRANAAWLLYYVTEDALRRSRQEPKAQHVLFDDVVVATEYIGPLKPKGR